MRNRESFDESAACRRPASFFTPAQQMVVFTEELYVRVGVVSIFTHRRGQFTRRVFGGTPPEHRERACQLRGNRVHDWITRGCNAIEPRLLVRHGVGGRGCRQHLQTASSGIHPRPFSLSRAPSIFIPALRSFLRPLLVPLSSSPAPVLAALASRARPKRAPN